MSCNHILQFPNLFFSGLNCRTGKIGVNVYIHARTVRFPFRLTGSIFSVPNLEKHCRHLKLHVSRIWRLILYFFSNASFLFFVFSEIASQLGWPVFSIDIVHIFDKILHIFPVRDIFTVITYCWEFDFCRKYFSIFGFSAIAVFFLFLL